MKPQHQESSVVDRQNVILERLYLEGSLINALLEHTQDHIYFKDLESRFVRVSRSMAEKAGLNDPAELTGKTDHDLFAREHAFQAWEDEQNIIRTGIPLINVEEYEIWAGGQENWVRTSKMPWVNEMGEIIGTMGISHNISESKKREDELRRSEERFRRLVENLGEGIVIADEQEQFLFANPAAEKIFGVQPGKMAGKNLKDFIGPQETEKVSRETGRRKKGEISTYDLKITRPDQESRYIHVTAAPNYNEENQYTDAIGIFRDITEELQLRQEIRESEEFLNNITGAAKDAMVVIDHRGNVIFWNRAAEGMFGYEKAEIMDRDFHDIMAPAEYHDAHKKGFAQFLKSGKGNAVGKSLELFALHKSGNNFPVELSLSALKVADHWNAVGIIRDITERKKNQNRLEELVKTKNKFFSIIAHDLKDPISTLAGFSDLLLKTSGTRDAEETEEMITHINKIALHGLNLLENLLEWSRSQTGRITYEPALFNIAQMVDEVVDLHLDTAYKKGIELKREGAADHEIFADRKMIHTVLRNLVSNALKFTRTGGSVHIGWKDSGKEFEFCISDTGVGIPAENLGKLFIIAENTSTHGTENERGTGLGLLLCKEFVEKNAGRIWVRSEPGNGSEFYFSIPKNNSNYEKER
ncbi:MAG: PAS domain S-box protein [Bacteroidota bacterium]